jgi:hypothetical protein
MVSVTHGVLPTGRFDNLLLIAEPGVDGHRADASLASHGLSNDG